MCLKVEGKEYILEIGCVNEEMEEVKRKRKNVRDCFWKQCVVCVSLLILSVIFYGVVRKQILAQQDLKRMCTDDFSFVFQIDEVREEGKTFILDGWAFKLGADAAEGSMSILLYDIEEEKIVYPKVSEYVEREDVNRYFLCEYDYTDCGMVVSFNSKKLDVAYKDYEILVSDEVNEQVYQTGTYISGGRLVYCSPKGHCDLQIDNMELERVINEGVLRVYEPENGTYVYQYEGKMYWFANNKFFFNEYSNTGTILHYYTTQVEKLPDARKQYKFDNHDFWYSEEAFEYGDWNVVIKKIPTDYSISKILTGNYREGITVWQKEFRPLYYFD